MNTIANNKMKFIGLIIFVLSTFGANSYYSPKMKTQPGHDKISEKSGDKTLSPYFFVKSDDPTVDKLPLKHTEADVNIAGVIADVTISQKYVNEGTNTIEAIYVFPASTKAAVYSMKMRVGDRTLIAKVEEREKARKDYERAKEQGKTASLLEQQRPNVFQMNVANILPGDIITIELKYTEMLVPENGVYEFVYPTVVGPRYSETPAMTASASDQWVANPYLTEGEDAPYTFNLSAAINTGIPVKDVTCTSHEVNINFDGAATALIKLKPSEKNGGDKDFILRYRLSGNQIETGMLLFEGKDENFFLAMLQPPKSVTPEQIPPREYIFIVDVSGSMNGYPLDISKKLLRNLIGNLRPVDKFNVILFAGGSNKLAPKSLPATQANINSAIHVIDRQRGGGGTRLLPALQEAIDMGTDENYSRTIVIATDGYVSVEKEAFDLIRSSLSDANVFSFGIGSSVNRFIIEGMARVGQGTPFVITKPEEAEAQAKKFRKYIESPVLTNIKVNYGNFSVYDVEPFSIPDVFSERPVIVYGKYKGEPNGKITLTGHSGAGEYLAGIDVGSITPQSSNGALRYLWARNRIAMLDDYNRLSLDDERVKEVTNLGLTYNLLTAYTSFVAIDDNVRNESGQLITVKQPLPLPEGVSNYAVGGALSANSWGFGCSKASKVKYKRAYDRSSLATEESKPLAGEKMELEDSISDEDNMYAIVETMPEFIGGQQKLMEFLKNNIKYPEKAKNNGVQGVVYISFIVDKNGDIQDIKVLKGVSDELDKEAVRVVKLMPKWKPGKQSGIPIGVSYTLPIKFALNQ